MSDALGPLRKALLAAPERAVALRGPGETAAVDAPPAARLIRKGSGE